MFLDKSDPRNPLVVPASFNNTDPTNYSPKTASKAPWPLGGGGRKSTNMGDIEPGIGVPVVSATQGV